MRKLIFAFVGIVVAVLFSGCGADKPRFEMGEYMTKSGEELRKLCDDKDFRACYFYGLAVIEEASQDLDQLGNMNSHFAKEIFEKACEGGDGMACSVLMELYVKGEFIYGYSVNKVSKETSQKYKEKAIDNLEKTCRAGYLTDCYYAMELLETPPRQKGYKERVEKLRETATKIQRDD